ncbi:MAG: DUF6364 family protein [Spirochaetia bacterium]
MPQISLYIDEKTMKKIESAAKQENLSISKWVANQLRAKLEPCYSDEFKDLYGSIEDPSFGRPLENGFSEDAPRQSL